jgi:cell division protein FtsQ
MALGVLCLIVVVAGAWYALHSRLFSARVVTVVGAVHTPVAQIERAAGLENQPPLLDVGAGAVAGIERLPWIAHATVSREWPDGVRITVVERTVAAAVPEVPATAGWALVDRSGRVLAVSPAPPPGVVRLSGTAPPGSPGSTVRQSRAALDVARTLPKAFVAQVRSVGEDPRGDVTLQLTSSLTVYLGSTSDLRRKYEDVAAILSGAQLASGEVIDVSAPSTPVVKP